MVTRVIIKESYIWSTYITYICWESGRRPEGEKLYMLDIYNFLFCYICWAKSYISYIWEIWSYICCKALQAKILGDKNSYICFSSSYICWKSKIFWNFKKVIYVAHNYITFSNFNNLNIYNFRVIYSFVFFWCLFFMAKLYKKIDY